MTTSTIIIALIGVAVVAAIVVALFENTSTRTRWILIGCVGILLCGIAVLWLPDSSSSSTAGLTSSHTSLRAIGGVRIGRLVRSGDKAGLPNGWGNPSTSDNTAAPSSGNSASQTAFISSFASLDSDTNVQIDPRTLEFVQDHPYWFPASSTDTSYEAQVDNSINIQDIAKQLDNYAATLYQGTGQVVWMRQLSSPTAYAEVQIHLPDGSDAEVIYNGKLEDIQPGYIVQFVGLPICILNLKEGSADAAKSVLLDGVSVTLSE